MLLDARLIVGIAKKFSSLTVPYVVLMIATLLFLRPSFVFDFIQVLLYWGSDRVVLSIAFQQFLFISWVTTSFFHLFHTIVFQAWWYLDLPT